MGRNSLDEKWERRLNIFTSAGDYEKEDSNHSRYEPTAYEVLERLAGSGYISREDVLVDYGCGKGRVGFFLNHALGIKTIGVEYNEALFKLAQANLAEYAGRNNRQVSFMLESAENYRPVGANAFYFFNPFSERILLSVIRRILDSYFDEPREMHLFFYYALDSYLGCLMNEDMLELVEEIDCRDLFHNDDMREKILVFKISA